ncbi:MAG: DNA polymerase III subunit beta [Candidatus Pacebacteria bacterium]|nr:DNA polymerase III subunit beta [Candidatus Paceibacterota bacterium]
MHSRKLYTGLQHIEKVAGKNLSLPILSKILIIAKDSSVILRATNLHVGAEVIIPAKVEQEGMVAVDGTIFLTTLSHTKKDKNITLEEDNGNIRLVSEYASTLIKSHHPEDFPNLPRIEEPVTFTLSLDSFVQTLKSVVYASAVSDIKPEISSVYMYPHEGNLVCVATDSFRLAEKKTKVKNLPEFDGILIPIKNVQDILKVFSGDKGEVTIAIGDNQISLTAEGVYLVSQLIDGVFPDYHQIIPKEFSVEVTALTSDILQAVRITNIFADKFNQVDIRVSSDDKKVVFSSRNVDIGENTTRIDAVIEGGSIETSINHRYLSEVFQSITTDSMHIGFVAENKPLIVRGVGSHDFLYLIMPIHR